MTQKFRALAAFAEDPLVSRTHVAAHITLQSGLSALFWSPQSLWLRVTMPCYPVTATD